MLNTAVPSRICQTLLRPSTTFLTSRTAWNIPGPSGTHRNPNLNAFKTSRTLQILAVSRPELSPETDPFGTKQKLPFRTQLELGDKSRNHQDSTVCYWLSLPPLLMGWIQELPRIRVSSRAFKASLRLGAFSISPLSA